MQPIGWNSCRCRGVFVIHRLCGCNQEEEVINLCNLNGRKGYICYCTDAYLRPKYTYEKDRQAIVGCCYNVCRSSIRPFDYVLIAERILNFGKFYIVFNKIFRFRKIY